MTGPRWRKLGRDVVVERGRVLLMVVAISVSLMGVGSVLGAYGILSREMPRNYLGTRPAAAALEIAGGVDRALVDEVRRRPGIAEAEAGDIVMARAKVADDWMPLLLFVVDDFNDLRLNRFVPLDGAWPPPSGTMLMERSAGQLLQAGMGQLVLVKAPHGVARSLRISGVVHDPGLAPAWQEREGYGYITPATLALLGESAAMGELRVAFSERPFDLDAIEAKVNELSAWLSGRGKPVVEARVPPPGKHPHQNQMFGVIFLMIAFSVMTLGLSAILVASSIAALMARQAREIGVMKALGARGGQLAWLFVAFVMLMGLVALVFAVPTGVGVARALAGMSARMLNLELADLSIPWWIFAVQGGAGLLVPLAFAAVPIVRSSRMTVREAMDQHGVDVTRAGERRVAWPLVLAGRTSRVSRTLSLVVRNTFRKRVRLILTLGLLSMGGAMFMAALNVSRGWEHIVDRVYEDRTYDVEVRLDAPAAVVNVVRTIEGVGRVEAWGRKGTAVWRAGQVDVVRTYPDGSHGSLTLVAPPVGTTLVRFPLLAGRWLEAGDRDAVVLNHMVLGQLPDTKVGDRITLSVDGRPTRWRVVGIVEEVGSAGAAYVTDEAFRRATGSAGRVGMLRIATSVSSPEERAQVIRAIDSRLAGEASNVEAVIPLAMLRTAMGDHVIVLIRMLLAMAALMATVGLLGLASTMGTNVLERSREIGTMKTVGATPRRIGRLVVGEALLVALLSWIVAAVVAVPLTSMIGGTVGTLAFRVKLPLTFDLRAVLGWLVLVGVSAAVATALPARRASRLTVWAALGRV